MLLKLGALPKLTVLSSVCALSQVWDSQLGWLAPTLKKGIIIGEWGGNLIGKDDVVQVGPHLSHPTCATTCHNWVPCHPTCHNATEKTTGSSW